MSDREVRPRARVWEVFGPFADCATEIGLRGGGRVDALVRPRRPDLAELCIAIECKDPARQIGDAIFGHGLKQCADYVGAMPLNGWPQIVASFAWLVDQPLDPRQEERSRMAGMVMLAAHFRVGWATGAAWPFDIAREQSPLLAHRGVTLALSLSGEVFRLNRGGFTDVPANCCAPSASSGRERRPPDGRLRTPTEHSGGNPVAIGRKSPE